jgi:hypothetical protein
MSSLNLTRDVFPRTWKIKSTHFLEMVLITLSCRHGQSPGFLHHSDYFTTNFVALNIVTVENRNGGRKTPCLSMTMDVTIPVPAAAAAP